MKKGFTLIELLAVIVILAIIALIATPIILGIINDARKESNERSAELYASAVRNAVAAYQLTGTTAPTKFSDLDIQHDGNVVCTTEKLYKDGSFYLADCTVNGDAVEYTYGTPKYEPQYYSWGNTNWTNSGWTNSGETGGKIGGNLPSDAKESVSDLDTLGFPFYLGLDVDNDNKVSAAYVCFKREGNDTEYCLKGADNGALNTNIAVLTEAYGKEIYIDAYDIYANDGKVYAHLQIGDYIDVNGSNGTNAGQCNVNDDGNFSCMWE